MSKKKVSIIIIIVTILVLVLSLSYWLSQNTSILNFDPNEKEIEQNNRSTKLVNQENINIVDLIPTQLFVPDKFQNGVLKDNKILNLPENFNISVYTAGLTGPRFFVFDDANNMIVADKDAGKLFLIKDNDQDGIADENIEVDKDLQDPHSVKLHKGDLYLGEETRITVYRDFTEEGTYAQKDFIIDDLPGGYAADTGRGHTTRTIEIGPDEKLYVSVGSSCNICEEKDERRAAVVQYDLDGSNEKIFATGLRNSVGIVFQDEELWSVNNGRDKIGDDIPPEEINIIKEGKHYGWPYCYGDGITNPEYPDRTDFCKNETEFPIYNMQAHSAPLGLTFLPETNNFPDQMNHDLIIAFHGSWNRTTPTGYKIVRIDPSSKENHHPVNFITGWLENNGKAWGRPVGVGFDNQGDLYISDDEIGVIYRIQYSK